MLLARGAEYIRSPVGAVMQSAAYSVLYVLRAQRCVCVCVCVLCVCCVCVCVFVLCWVCVCCMPSAAHTHRQVHGAML